MVPAHLSAVLDKLEATGAQVEVGADRVRIRADDRPRATDIVTNPFPGFATDMQAQMMTLLGLAEGSSVITETIFENRFQHAAELRRLGASIEIEGSRAVIRGVPSYQGAPVMATDLRASAVAGARGPGGRGHDRGVARLPPRPRLRGDGAEARRARGADPPGAVTRGAGGGHRDR